MTWKTESMQEKKTHELINIKLEKKNLDSIRLVPRHFFTLGRSLDNL